MFMGMLEAMDSALIFPSFPFSTSYSLSMDFEEPSSNPATREFQAVLLAGFGNE